MASKVVKFIPANPEVAAEKSSHRQLRVAAYCRVSTDDEEQLTSYEAQKTYYTDKIMSNPAWTMAGIFADEGITGTQARKRPEFLRMIRLCKQKKIDLVLAKSISRFARNTVDCLNYIRVLKELGIAVIFEKENINTLETDSELITTMMGAFAQAESESMSANIRWGKRQAMREGKVSFQYTRLYGYRKGQDNTPEIIPEEAEVIKSIFKSYLAGETLRAIKDRLNAENATPPGKGEEWSVAAIQRVLRNEKYCGDVLMQKTFVSDCISGKVEKNNGQLPMYLVENNHEGIVDRQIFQRTQSEIARRAGSKAPSKKTASTGLTRYSGKYALTERLVCGECGTLYKRCTWTQKGEKRIVWRCISRLDYGKKYCHSSPTMDEVPLQNAIMEALNSIMAERTVLIRQITDAMQTELNPISGEFMSLSDIDNRIAELNARTSQLMKEAKDNGGLAAYSDQFKEIMNEIAELKKRKSAIAAQQANNIEMTNKTAAAVEAMNNFSAELTEWDDTLVRQLVDTVKVLAKDRILLILKSGKEIEWTVRQEN